MVGVGTELPPGLEGCYVLEEQQRLQEERMLFQRQQQAFEAERQSFTEAAIRLGHEVEGEPGPWVVGRAKY